MKGGWAKSFLEKGLKCVLLLKYWPAVRVVSETHSGLSQRDIKKAALYSHTSRRNNNEPQGL